MTNYLKAKIDNTQKDCNFKICGDKEEKINHLIYECGKLAQKKYNSRHDCEGKVILQ